MRLISLAIQCLAAYFYLLVVLRLAGKRSLTRATPFDLVLSLAMGDLVDNAIWREIPLAHFFVAVATLAAARVFVGTHGPAPGPFEVSVVRADSCPRTRL
jgi:uncharacterized membrane protein YcaP (DUF421 family)